VDTARSHIKKPLIKKPTNIGLALRRFFVFVLPAFVLVAAFGGNAIMGALKDKPEEKDEAPKATPVVAVDAQAEDVRLTVTTQGEVTPRTQINLASYVSGRIAYVSSNFIEGGIFKKGELLIEIEDAEFAFRVRQARSSVAQASSRYATEKAEAEAAKRDFKELGIGEGSALALRKPQLAEAAALLDSAKASLGEAELQLARTKITAPFDGRIRERMVDIGEFVTPGAALGRIFATNIMEVRLPMTDSELGQLGLSIGFQETTEEKGPTVKLTSLVAGAPRLWHGRIVRTDSGFDQATRSLFAYVAVEDPYGTGADNGVPLASGLFVTAEIAGRSIESAVVVPRAAIRGESSVYVVTKENTLEIRDVILATSDRTRAVLTAGLEPGERVITPPVRAAATGMTIAVAGDEPDDATRIADRATSQE